MFSRSKTNNTSTVLVFTSCRRYYIIGSLFMDFQCCSHNVTIPQNYVAMRTKFHKRTNWCIKYTFLFRTSQEGLINNNNEMFYVKKFKKITIQLYVCPKSLDTNFYSTNQRNTIYTLIVERSFFFFLVLFSSHLINKSIYTNQIEKKKVVYTRAYKFTRAPT